MKCYSVFILSVGFIVLRLYVYFVDLTAFVLSA